MSPSARVARAAGRTPPAARHLALVAPESGAPGHAPRVPSARGAVVLILALGMLSLVALVATLLAALPLASLPAR